jgi:hypothetical protein
MLDEGLCYDYGLCYDLWYVMVYVTIMELLTKKKKSTE